MWDRKRKFATFVIFVPVAALTIMFAMAPRTPAQRFRFDTGLKFPSDAVVLDDIDRMSTPLVDNFKSEGTRVFHFRTLPSNVRQWVSTSPPWGDLWKFGEPPMRINETRWRRPMHYCTTGDDGLGSLLVMDIEMGECWLVHWKN